MKNIIRKMLSFLILTALLIGSTSFALAIDPANVPPADEISNDPNESLVEIEFYSTQGATGFSIVQATSSIKKLSSTSVSCSASTSVSQLVPTVSNTIRLQKYENGQWHNVNSSGKTAINSSSCSQTKVFTVQAGYYYRAYTFHVAESASDSDSKYAISKAILVE